MLKIVFFLDSSLSNVSNDPHASVFLTQRAAASTHTSWCPTYMNVSFQMTLEPTYLAN